MQKDSNSYRSSKFSTAWRAIFALLGLSLFVSSGAFSATQIPKNPFCQAALVDKHFEAAPGEVKAAIAARTAPLKRGQPYIVERATGEKIDVLEAINRELAMPVLDSSKVFVLNQIAELTTVWEKAFVSEVEAVYAGKQSSSLKGADTTYLDERGLPDAPMVQQNAELALEIIKNSKTKPGPSHLESQVARQLMAKLRKTYFEKIKAVADQKMTEAEDYLAETFGKKSPDWNLVIDAIEPIYREYFSRLAEAFPLESNSEFSERAHAVTKAPLERFVNRAVIGEDGVLEVRVPELKIRARYDVELGTVVLEPLKPVLIRKDQKKGDLEAPVFLTDHGDGTVKSNASSWKYILAKFFSSGFNAIAMNLPKSGIGMDLTGLRSTVAYLQYRFEIVAQRHKPKAGEVRVPIIQLGRSMGSQKGFAHAVVHEGEGNPVNSYVLTSTSNPYTIDMQLSNVFQQVKNGTIKGVIPEMLDNAGLVSKELAEMLEQIEKNNPEAFKHFGDKMLMLQGNADEDGGSTAVPDLVRFQTRFAPLAHVYVFENRLVDYDIPNREKIDPEKWEGTHTLFSNLENVTKEVAARVYPGVPAVDIPALQDQYFEAMGVIWGQFDYLADSRVQLPEIQKSAKIFSDYREKLTGGKTYVEWYREKQKISDKDFAEARPGRESRAARLKRAVEFWKSERARVDAVYRTMGLLP